DSEWVRGVQFFKKDTGSQEEDEEDNMIAVWGDEGSLVISRDDGATWSAISRVPSTNEYIDERIRAASTLPDDFVWGSIRDSTILNDYQTVAAWDDTGSLALSDDGGITWDVTVNFRENGQFHNSEWVRDVQFLKKDTGSQEEDEEDNMIAVWGDEGSLVISRDDGATWSAISRVPSTDEYIDVGSVPSSTEVSYVDGGSGVLLWNPQAKSMLHLELNECGLVASQAGNIFNKIEVPDSIRSVWVDANDHQAHLQTGSGRLFKSVMTEPTTDKTAAEGGDTGKNDTGNACSVTGILLDETGTEDGREFAWAEEKGFREFLTSNEAVKNLGIAANGETQFVQSQNGNLAFRPGPGHAWSTVDRDGDGLKVGSLRGEAAPIGDSVQSATTMAWTTEDGSTGDAAILMFATDQHHIGYTLFRLEGEPPTSKPYDWNSFHTADAGLPWRDHSEIADIAVYSSDAGTEPIEDPLFTILMLTTQGDLAVANAHNFDTLMDNINATLDNKSRPVTEMVDELQKHFADENLPPHMRDSVAPLLSFLAREAAADAREGRTRRSSLDKHLGETTIPRVFSVVVIFYVVHLFIRLQQYYAKIAAHHDARADAILLIPSYGKIQQNMAYPDLVDALSAENVGFGRMPKEVVAQATEMAKGFNPRSS
ncbi:MAG: exo-alpha-sialidase, partial [Rhodospirillales bacterium]|nr:exo-alpha-sialidase [Rhodospirillales bacterium]